MPNRWTRNSSDTLVPKVGGTKPDGSIVAAKLADDSVEGRTVDYYKSPADVTGTGGALNIAHGLGRSPLLVIVIPVNNTTGNTLSIVEGSHDATNVVVTAPATTKFRVVAL
tara:strand:- start:138 stop:470 length:333 start_codon:yes stop_codon:yes gene_type:complete